MKVLGGNFIMSLSRLAAFIWWWWSGCCVKGGKIKGWWGRREAGGTQAFPLTQFFFNTVEKKNKGDQLTPVAWLCFVCRHYFSLSFWVRICVVFVSHSSCCYNGWSPVTVVTRVQCAVWMAGKRKLLHGGSTLPPVMCDAAGFRNEPRCLRRQFVTLFLGC